MCSGYRRLNFSFSWSFFSRICASGVFICCIAPKFLILFGVLAAGTDLPEVGVCQNCMSGVLHYDWTLVQVKKRSKSNSVSRVKKSKVLVRQGSESLLEHDIGESADKNLKSQKSLHRISSQFCFIVFVAFWL